VRTTGEYVSGYITKENQQQFSRILAPAITEHGLHFAGTRTGVAESGTFLRRSRELLASGFPVTSVPPHFRRPSPWRLLTSTATPDTEEPQ
jgi:hypothetical protein